MPAEDPGTWYNILVLHQNRAKHGPTNYIPENFLPEFLHLVVWGHEHECRMEPEKMDMDFFVVQPGSPVATSLCEGEAVQKKVLIFASIAHTNHSSVDSFTHLFIHSVHPEKALLIDYSSFFIH